MYTNHTSALQTSAANVRCRWSPMVAKVSLFQVAKLPTNRQNYTLPLYISLKLDIVSAQHSKLQNHSNRIDVLQQNNSVVTTTQVIFFHQIEITWIHTFVFQTIYPLSNGKIHSVLFKDYSLFHRAFLQKLNLAIWQYSKPEPSLSLFVLNL